jgi:uncharacterized protein
MMTIQNKRAAIEANRRRYEALKAAGQGQTPRALPPLSLPGAVPVEDAAVLHRETIPGGWYWHTTIRRGEALRITNVEGTSAISLAAWNAHDVSERINHADTVKVQWTTSLRRGRIILSDMGRVMFAITEDSCGAHDAIIGVSNAGTNASKYAGDHRNTHENFVLAAGKLGLPCRDIASSITFFAPVVVGANGQFIWDATKRKPGDFVELRAEMDLLVALSNCPHPLDPEPSYAPGPASVIRFKPPREGVDACRTGGAEAVRAYENTDALFLA